MVNVDPGLVWSTGDIREGRPEALYRKGRGGGVRERREICSHKEGGGDIQKKCSNGVCPSISPPSYPHIRLWEGGEVESSSTSVAKAATSPQAAPPSLLPWEKGVQSSSCYSPSFHPRPHCSRQRPHLTFPHLSLSSVVSYSIKAYGDSEGREDYSTPSTPCPFLILDASSPFSLPPSATAVSEQQKKICQRVRFWWGSRVVTFQRFNQENS